MTTSDYLTQLQQDKQDLIDNLTEKGIEGLTGDETFTELVPEVLNISGGGSSDLDWSAIGYNETPNSIIAEYEYATQIKNEWVPATSLYQKFQYDSNLIIMPLVDTSIATEAHVMFHDCKFLREIPLLDISNVTLVSDMFNGCENLYKIPQLDTSKVTNFQAMFKNCYKLHDVPILNMSSLAHYKGILDMFYNCKVLSDESLDNILKSCITANPDWTGTKTLGYMGISSTYYPASKIQALPHYQDFINAGWAIGYN